MDAAQKKTREKLKEEVIASDVIIKTTGKVEIIEEAAPQDEAIPAANPLTEFKEKMIKEEMPVSDDPQKKNYMWPILLIFIIAILLLFGVFLYKSGGIEIGDKINVVTLSPTPAAIPEPTKTVDLTKYEIEIQNGSGVSGEASRQKANLESEGFIVSSIGNADNSDYTDTIVKAKTEVDKNFIVKLKTVLNNTFTVGETEILSEDSSAPVVIILGTQK